MTLTARFTTSRILVGAHDYNVAVTIGAPAGRSETRPPISLAVVIDRSASMGGEPFERAKAATARLLEQLGSDDAFAIVGFATDDTSVVPIVRATPDNKARARAAIDALTYVANGGTCTGCGLTRGAGELTHSPIAGGVSRIVLISDGQANDTPSHSAADLGTIKEDLVQLAADTAARGISLSTVGVGLGFDEVTMIQLARVGRGNYYFLDHTGELDAMFASELAGLAGTVAADVRLVLRGGPGSRIEDVYGYPFTRTGDQVIVPIADLGAGDVRRVVLRVRVAAGRTGPLAPVDAELVWRRVADGAPRRATTAARVEVVDDPAAVADSMDFAAIEAVERALSARAFEDASVAYDRYGAAAAQQVIQYRVNAVHSNRYLSGEAVNRFDAAHAEAIRSFAAAPSGGDDGTRAKKVSRVRAYQLAR